MAKSSKQKQQKIKLPLRSPKPQRACCVGSQCADICDVLNNPFNTSKLLALPDEPAVMSGRFMSKVRGTGQTGAGKAGQVSVKTNMTVANDVMGIVHSNTTAFATTTIMDAGAVAPAGAAKDATDAFYANADYGAVLQKKQYRIVAAALRLRYTGTTLNKGGRVVATTTTGTADVIVGESGFTGHVVGWRAGDFNDKWFEVTYLNTAAASTWWTSTTAQATQMAIQIESAAADQPFEWEYRVWYEVVGHAVANKQPNFADPVGWAALSNAYVAHQQYRTGRSSSVSMRDVSYAVAGQSHVESFLGGVGNALRSFMPTPAQIGSAAGNVAANALRSMLQPRIRLLN